jgi:hypothetical protein
MTDERLNQIREAVFWLLTAVYLIASTGCSGAAAPPPPVLPTEQAVATEAEYDRRHCQEWEKRLRTKIPGTTVAVPFGGARTIDIIVDQPEWFGNRSVYVQDVTWDADWVTEAWLAVDATRQVFAYWNGAWSIDESLDVSPFFEPFRENEAKMVMYVRGKGVKPAGKVEVVTDLLLLVCHKPLPPEPPTTTPVPEPNDPGVEPPPRLGVDENCPSC